jgi:Holliday junction resolvase RusA-like endonuclease
MQLMVPRTKEPNMSQLNFSVNGRRPVPWGCDEWEWRAAIAQEARKVASELPAVPLNATFSVALVFRMRSERIEHADLDNLAKPVLDTIFLSRHSQVKDPSLAGAMFAMDDDRVFRLSVEKRSVRTVIQEGVDITISW